VFFALCYLLNRRDRNLKANLAQPLPTAKAKAPVEATAAEPEREKVDAGV